MPCESKINSSKSNYPMGEVVSGDTGNGWTKVGNGNDGNKYWEPADEWKGELCLVGVWRAAGVEIRREDHHLYGTIFRKHLPRERLLPLC